MQEIIVFAIVTIAMTYLIIKFISKRKSHDCDNCGITENKELKKH